MRLKLAWGTDPGLQRADNEDAVLVWQARAGLQALLVVCDGMGGHAAGRLASSIAVEAFAQTLAGDGLEGPSPERLLLASAEANAAVHQRSRSSPSLKGMGSTLVSAAIAGGELGVVNIGDSPAWLYRDGDPTLISQDHSWPAEQVRMGVIGLDEAKNHPMKHRLTRAIGVWENIPAYANRIKVRAGDLLVLCSDGVETAGVGVEEMGRLLANGDLGAGVRRVIARCRELGAPDNVTVAVAAFEAGEMKTEPLPAIRREEPTEPTAVLRTAVNRRPRSN